MYWYDAAGERTVKESFDNEGVYVNGALSGARTGTSKFTAYVSPFMVVSQGGNYTKHVYMGSQRITSKVSNSVIFTTSPVKDTLQAKLTAQTIKIKERFDSLGVKYSGVQQTGGLVSASPNDSTKSYFYHSDHLGSSSLITNKDGYLVQHIQYVPFGEVFVEERNATWSTPYKFNGKEQDEETGLCYYGARYYDPRTSVWLSVDPLAEKYAGRSSYEYCLSNPIAYIDHDGRFSKKWMANLSRGFYNLTHKEKADPIIENKEAKKEVNRYTYQTHGVENGVATITSHSKFQKGGAQAMQNIGDGVAVVGYAATLSVVGAEVGVPLAAAGNIVSSVGSAWELGIDLLNGDWGDGGKKVGFYLGGKLIDKGLNKVLPGFGKEIREEGFDLGTEIITQGVSLKKTGVERVTDAIIDKKNNESNQH